MEGQDLVRPTRDGDQFHYHWAARQCLQLLPGDSDLVAVTVEGSSSAEADGDNIGAGEELIDVGLYFGSEARDQARLIRYVQLKHSTRRTQEPWTTSGLKKTIRGFAQRYAKLLGSLSSNDVANRFRFEFITNRPIDGRLAETLVDLAEGRATQHSTTRRTLIKYSGLDEPVAEQFFALFSAEGGEADLWAQRNLLVQDLEDYLPDADYDAPVQLKELVTRKATTEFESNPSIRLHDVLIALKADEALLQPAPCLIPKAIATLAREQEQEILGVILQANNPVVIHAEAGIGKSMLAARLAASMPLGSEAVLYDCFGDGLYRNAQHFRHRARDALVQIANELAARKLCHPLIPTPTADLKQYLRAFVGRLTQAINILRASNPEARLCLLVDAADNAEMAAEERGEAAGFVKDLIRASVPDGICLIFTCRTHRTWRLAAPPGTAEIELHSFSKQESAKHLRTVHASASDPEVEEFHFLSSANPRVQALALSSRASLQELLKQLGPTPTTVDRTIEVLLESAIARIRDQSGVIEAAQIEVICQALAVLRPLVPIPILAKLSGVTESAVRSFAIEFGRPLFLKGNSVHFLDEPAETWFRENYQPDAAGLVSFLDRLRPLTSQSSYASALFPQLLLQAGKLGELVDLALSGTGLPDNPLEKRDVELQRLTFALKASLQQCRYKDAAKLALKAGGECAGEERQNQLIQSNTDIAAVLMAPDRIDEIVSRRIFNTGWMGSHHAYNAGLLSGQSEFHAEASSHLRMAIEWLQSWARLPEEDRRDKHVDDDDRTELAMALLRLRGADSAARFLRRWRWQPNAFLAGRLLARRLLDIGRHEQVDELATAARNDVWLLLGLAIESRAVGHVLPAAPLRRLLRLLSDRRVKLEEFGGWEDRLSILFSITSAVEMALLQLADEHEKWATLLRRYLPDAPPTWLADRHSSDPAPLVRAYALEAALRGETLGLLDIAPQNVREKLEEEKGYARTQEAEVFRQEVGGLLPWLILSAEVSCGRVPESLDEAIQNAVKATSSAEARIYQQGSRLRQAAAIEWLTILRNISSANVADLETIKSWLDSRSERLWGSTLTTLCRIAAQSEGFEGLALQFAGQVYQELEGSREHADSRTDSYVQLARAILIVSPEDARIFFNRAVEMASRIGDENLHRWSALLDLATRAGENNNPRSRSAYRLSQVAELTYEYVARDKYFDWERTVKALTELCAPSAIAILCRWRDRDFGDCGRLFPVAIYHLLKRGRLPHDALVAFAGLDIEWDRAADLKRAVQAESDVARRSVLATIAYRYIRVQPFGRDVWVQIRDLGRAHSIPLPDIDRLVHASPTPFESESDSPGRVSGAERDIRSPDWDTVFEGVNLADSTSLHSVYASVRDYDPPSGFETFFREALIRVRAGRESEVIRATANWPEFDYFKLRHVLDALPSPLPAQVSLRSAVRYAVLKVCRSQPHWVQRRGWGSLIPYERLDAEGIVSDADVVQATLEGFAEQCDALSAAEFFKIVDSLASCLSPAEADEALNFGCDLLESVLRPDEGDGPWRPELEPPQTIIAALAASIWTGLGSPTVAERWQYSHVVRSVVEMGWSEMLDPLLANAEAGFAGAFADQGLEFYVWHARQWLLIGLARGALENPSALRSAVPLLLSWLREEHVLIRAFAARILRVLVASGALESNEVGDLESINRSQLPEHTSDSWSHPLDDEAPTSEGTLTEHEKYHFGIDIGPYWFAPLGRVFGLTQEAVERRARASLRKFMGWDGGGRLDDARHTRKIFRDRATWHSHGGLPAVDDLCAYHGYHAMMFVAADLLEERPVRRDPDENMNRFDDWLSSYELTRPDGRWLADRRDPKLVDEPLPPNQRGDNSWRWCVTAENLDRKLLTDDGRIVLWGHWVVGDEDHKETVWVRSALVCRHGAPALLAALQTASDLDRSYLPSERQIDGLQSGSLKLLGWVEDITMSARLEEEDPWSRKLSYPGARPSRNAVEKVCMSASPDARIWNTDNDGELRSELWTVTRGYGRELDTIPGERLSGNQPFIRSLLNAYSDCQLILSVEVRRWPPRYGRSADEESYPAPYARYYLMGDDLVPHTL